LAYAEVQFQVKLGKATMNFSEVSGLDAEAQIIEYHNQESKDFYPIKMPGIGKVGNVTLKRGVFVGDQGYWDWYSQVKLNSVTKGRETIQIELMNENGQTNDNDLDLEQCLSNKNHQYSYAVRC
jgi:phage tail-like protein